MLVALVEAGRLEDGEGTVTPIGGKPWLPPSALMMLANMLPDRIRGERVERVIHDENAQGPFDIENVRPRLILISYLTTGRLRAYQMAFQAHEARIPVGAGGIDITGHHKDGFEQELLSFFPAIHIGRATRGSIARMMTSLMTGSGERVHRALPDEPWEFAPLAYNLIDRRAYRFSASLSLSLGCSHNCNFCAVALICEGKVHVKPVEVVAEDISHLPKPWFCPRRWAPIVLYDDTLGMMSKEEFRRFLSMLKDTGRPWFCETTAKLAKALLPLLHEHGCVGTYLGMESVSEPYDSKNVGIAEMDDIFAWEHDHGMITCCSFAMCVQNRHGEFYERPDVFARTADYVNERRLVAAQFSLGYPISGTPFRRSVVQAGLMRDWNSNHSDGSFLVYQHPYITERQALDGIRDAYTTVYNEEGRRARLSHLRSTFSAPMAKIIGLTNRQIWRSVENWWVNKVNIDYWRQTAMTREQYELAIESIRTCGKLPEH